MTTTTYAVVGTAHGSFFRETGFDTDTEAMEYASEIISGDYESTIEIVRTLSGHGRFTCSDLDCGLCAASIES